MTVRAIGPAMSRSNESGMTPSRLVRPMVERIPTSARWEDGPLIEFPVSLPSPATAKLAATPEAVPPLDPAGTRSRSYAFAVVSYEELTVCLALKAHSAMLVLAITTASASRTRRTMKASSGGRLPIRAIEPPVVGRSCVSKLSFTSMGTQNSGPSSSPAATAASISSALPRALAFTTVIAFTVDSSYASIRSRWVCTTIRHVVRPSLMDSWIRAIVDSTTSMGCAVGPQAAAARAQDDNGAAYSQTMYYGLQERGASEHLAAKDRGGSPVRLS